MNRRWDFSSHVFRRMESKRWKYSQKCINRIINEVSIVDVIGDLFVRPIQSKNKSRYYLELSPFSYLEWSSRGGRPFYCSTDKRRFKCFHTGAAGNVIIFVELFLNTNRRGAITWILHKYGLHMKDIVEKTRSKVIYNLNGKYNDLPF